MFRCKWAGDPDDEYCKGCDGLVITVDDVEKDATECAGFEKGEEVADANNEPEELPFNEDVPINKPEPPVSPNKPSKPAKTNNNTPKKEKAEKSPSTTLQKVSSSKKAEEDVEIVPAVGVNPCVSKIRYESNATVKKGDNYFKFTACEEWDTAFCDQTKMDDIREQLWAKLNSEVDKQIEELINY